MNKKWGIRYFAGYWDTSNGGIIIHHNALIDNYLDGTSQARDSSELDDIENIWYDEILLEGNYWSDWVSGVYYIDGSAGSVDPYPLSSNPL